MCWRHKKNVKKNTHTIQYNTHRKFFPQVQVLIVFTGTTYQMAGRHPKQQRRCLRKEISRLGIFFRSHFSNMDQHIKTWVAIYFCCTCGVWKCNVPLSLEWVLHTFLKPLNLQPAQYRVISSLFRLQHHHGGLWPNMWNDRPFISFDRQIHRA